MRTHTTRQGDTWDMIALKYYGDEKKMDALMKANTEHLETLFFSAGVILNIPANPTPQAVDPPKPWER